MKKRNVMMLAAVCCGIASMVICSPAFAAGIGINFVGNGGSLTSGQGFGFVGQTNWNNLSGVSGGPTAIVDDSGGAAGTVSWNSGSLGSGGIPGGKDPAVNPGACNLCSGPQDGYAVALGGTLRSSNSFGAATPGQQVTATFTGLSSLYSSYDVFVYFNATNDQGDQYNAEFNDGVNPVINVVPASPTPLVDTAGRSAGDWYGYDDNGQLIGNSSSGFGDQPEDSMASTLNFGGSGVGILLNGVGALSGDTLIVTVYDTNNNGNNGTPTPLGGPNYGPNADLGVAAIQIIGVPVPEPGTLVLAGLGLLGLAGFGWSRRKR